MSEGAPATPLQTTHKDNKKDGDSRGNGDIPNNIALLLKRIRDPCLLTDTVDDDVTMKNSTDLLFTPWTLQLGNENGNDSATQVVTAAQQQQQQGFDDDDDNDEATDHERDNIYPPWCYLDLRRKQNIQWATERLQEGIRFAKQGKSSQAEACYKVGLELVPTHAELLVAYGALCANLGRTQEAMEMLQRALDVDPECPNAQQYMDTIQKQMNAPATVRRQAGSLNRSEKALQDVLMERSFLTGINNGKRTGNHNDEDYPLVYEETPTIGKVDDNSSLERESRNRRRHHKKGKRSHRSHYRRSRSRKKKKRDHSVSSDESSEDSSSRVRRNKKHRRRRRRRSSTSDSDSTNERSQSRRSGRRQTHREVPREREDLSIERLPTPPGGSNKRKDSPNANFARQEEKKST